MKTICRSLTSCEIGICTFSNCITASGHCWLHFTALKLAAWKANTLFCWYVVYQIRGSRNNLFLLLFSRRVRDHLLPSCSWLFILLCFVLLTTSKVRRLITRLFLLLVARCFFVTVILGRFVISNSCFSEALPLGFLLWIVIKGAAAFQTLFFISPFHIHHSLSFRTLLLSRFFFFF